MKRTWLAALVAAGLLPATAWAADHTDGPAVIADPAADINDVYTFLSDDFQNLNIIMTLFPGADNGSEFSDQVQYVMHVESAGSIGALLPQTETNIICQFDAGTIECWAGDTEYVTGDASDEAGITSDSGDLRVFAGLRNDPFFFKLAGFNMARETVRDAAGALTFDENGCPGIDADTSAALIGMLQSGEDFFSPLDTLAIVVQVPVSLVNPGGDILGIWGSTHARPAN